MASIFGTFSLPVPEAEKVNLYPLTKSPNAEGVLPLDEAVLSTVVAPAQGDIAVVDTVVDNKNVNKSAYMWNGEQWVALNGNVDADKVILTSDITMAGDYTQVGNLTKTKTGTATFETKGLSVAAALTQIFSKRLQPKITANPSVGVPTVSLSGVVEAGTVVQDVVVSAASFSAGTYTYGPATGVTATSWKTTRVTNNGNTDLANVGTGGAVTDTDALTIGDQTGDYTSILYRVTATYGDGVVANDNLGDPSDPEIKISGSSTYKDSAAITSFRKYFHGTTATVPATIDSAYIRALTNSDAAATNGMTFEITIPDGAMCVVFAYPATLNDATKVENVGGLYDDILSSFTKETIKVEGANGYTGIEYKVYSYKSETKLGANTFIVTL